MSTLKTERSKVIISYSKINFSKLKNIPDDILLEAENNKLLSNESILRLVRLFQEEDNQDAFLLIVAKNIGLIVSIAWHYKKASGMPLDDLIQEAILGLRNAVVRNNFFLVNRFMSFAAWHIRSVLQRIVAKNCYRTVKTVSFSESITSELDSDDYEKFIKDEKDVNSLIFSMTLERKTELENIFLRIISEVKKRNNSRDIKIFKKRFPFDVDSKPTSFVDLGIFFGLSHETIRVIERKILKQLRFVNIYGKIYATREDLFQLIHDYRVVCEFLKSIKQPS